MHLVHPFYPAQFNEPPLQILSYAGAAAAEAPSGRRAVPGAQSVWIKTFGCSHNTSDSEYMAGLLTEYGYR